MFKNNQKKSSYWLLILFAILALNTGCGNMFLQTYNSLQTYRMNKKMSGKIESDRYFAPRNHFSLCVPERCQNGCVSDSFEFELTEKNETLISGSVRFFGPTQMYSLFDEYYSINIIDLPEEAMFRISKNPEEKEKMLRDVLSMEILEDLKSLTNQAEIVYSEIVLLQPSEPTLFAQIDLPGLQNKLHNDSYMASAGILVTTVDNSIVAVSTIRPFSCYVTTERKSTILNEKVLALYRTFSLNK